MSTTPIPPHVAIRLLIEDKLRVLADQTASAQDIQWVQEVHMTMTQPQRQVWSEISDNISRMHENLMAIGRAPSGGQRMTPAALGPALALTMRNKALVDAYVTGRAA